MNSLATRLKAERDTHGWSQDDLARHAGVRQSFVGALEAGNQRSSGYLPEIAHALNVDAYWLKTGRGQRQPIYKSASEQSSPDQHVLLMSPAADYNAQQRDDETTRAIIEIARSLDEVGKGMLLERAEMIADKRRAAAGKANAA